MYWQRGDLKLETRNLKPLPRADYNSHMNGFRIIAAAAFCLGLTGLTTAGEPEPYMRLTEVDATTTTLDVAARRFEPADGTGPTIWLSGVIHIGEPDYYQKVQQHLDDHGLVLFEGVAWPPFARRTPANDENMRERARTAIRFIAGKLEQYKSKHGDYPDTLAPVEESFDDTQRLHASFFKMAQTDAWGHPIQYERTDSGYTLQSLGADGKVGGEGIDADLSFADQPPLTESERGDHHGLQNEMATALDLVFQLEHIDYTRPTFVNSDVPMGRIQNMVAADGGGDSDLAALMSMMDGTSIFSGIIKFGLRLVGSSPKLQAMTRLVLMETLGQIRGDISQMQGMPANMKRLMQKLIVERNKIVLADLKHFMNQPDAPDSISIFYGAGHMHDLEARLVDELGYEPAETIWLPAMTEDLSDAGLTEQDKLMIRGLIKFQMMQMRNFEPVEGDGDAASD